METVVVKYLQENIVSTNGNIGLKRKKVRYYMKVTSVSRMILQLPPVEVI